MKWASRKKAICLVYTGRRPELPYPLKGGAAHLPNPRHRQCEGLADLYPFADAPAIDDTLLDLNERKPIKVRDFP